MNFDLLKHQAHKKSTWVVAGIALVIIGIIFWIHSERYPSTDDAYIEANIVNMATQVSGPVTQVYVSDNQTVKAGQLLFEIDPTPFQIAVTKAQAQVSLSKQQTNVDDAAVQTAQAKVQQAQAELEVEQKNAPRILTLVSEGKLAKIEGTNEQGKLDSAKAALEAAQSQLQEAIQQLGNSGNANAQVQAAYAGLAEADLNLSHTKIYAPASGQLVNFDVRPGMMITAGQSLFALIDDSQWWSAANFKETDLKNIRINQKATIEIDIYPGKKFHGYVQSISAGSGSAFSLLPPENATGNWVKVTQRFPIKVVITNPDPNYPLRVGASSTVTIDTEKFISTPNAT